MCVNVCMCLVSWALRACVCGIASFRFVREVQRMAGVYVVLRQKHFFFHCCVLCLICRMAVLASATLFLLSAVQPLAGSAPVANVRLSPPSTLPGIDVELRSLEEARASSESVGFGRLDAAFSEAIRNAEARIGKTVAELIPSASGVSHASSFLGESANEAAKATKFRLKVSPMPAPSRAVKQRVKLVEGVRAAQEDALITQGVNELHMLVDIVLGELSSEIAALKAPTVASSGVGFLELGTLGGSLDVRFLPPEVPFPTVAALVQELEDRRAESESTVRQRIAEVQLKLLQSLNSMVKSALQQRLASL